MTPEDTPNIPRLGNVKATAELRRSLEEADRCREFFERGKFVDYLDSVNRSFLGEQGKITGPTLKISSGFELDEEERVENAEPLGLNENAHGGLRALLEYAPDQHKKGAIAIFLSYRDERAWFVLSLSADMADNMEDTDNTNPISAGRFLSRRFLIEPTDRMVGDVDDLLLTFTDELLEEKFI